MADTTYRFDTNIAIDIPNFRSAAGPVNLELRWPTDAEWSERARKRKLIVRQLGRGVSETMPETNSEADQKICQAIQKNGSNPLSAIEATAVLDTLAACDVMDVALEGDTAEVTLRVMGGRVRHRLKLPTAEQVFKFRRAAVRILNLPYNQQDLRIYLEPAVELWAAIGGASEDYASGIPSIHKDAAVRAVIDYADRLTGMQGDENF